MVNTVTVHRWLKHTWCGELLTLTTIAPDATSDVSILVSGIVLRHLANDDANATISAHVETVHLSWSHTKRESAQHLRKCNHSRTVQSNGAACLCQLVMRLNSVLG